MLNAVEYAKDGLLPLVEALGPDPWLLRLREVMDAVLAESDTPTPAGTIPSPAAEVNGSALQALARLTWATNDPDFLQMGRQIASAYLDHTLPTTEYLPPHRWDFMENEPIGPRRFYLGDHGNEIVAGLVEWHRVETRLALPEAAAHREAINKMLDRLLQKGRTPQGLWYEIIDVPSGKVRDKDLTDNWGYLGQAYLDQAASERDAAFGDPASAARFEQASAMMLRAVTTVDFYEWESGDMDGYADTLESALYLLRYIDDPAGCRLGRRAGRRAVRLPARRRLGDRREHRRQLRAHGPDVRALADARHPAGAVDATASRWAPRSTAPACASTSTPRRPGAAHSSSTPRATSSTSASGWTTPA